MNNWYTLYKQHRLQQELADINQLIDGAVLKTTDVQQVANYERLVAVVKQYTSFVQGLDPNLTTQGYLNTLVEPLPQLKASLAAYLTSNNISQLQSANSQADQLTQRFPPYLVATGGTALTAAAADFSKQVGNLLALLEEQSKKYSEQVQQVISKGESIGTKLSQQEQVIEQQKGRLDKAIADFQKQFSESEANRRKQVEESERQHSERFNAFRDEITKQVKSLVDQKQIEVQNSLSQFKEQAKQAIAELESRKKQAADLVQVTANITVTGNYEKLAGEESKSANTWRWIAIGSMAALVVAAILIIEVSIRVGTFDWKLMAFRFATAIILILPGAYAVTESARHRKMEYRYRRMQLELASIDPFLESLQKDQRDTLKKQLAERIFAQPESDDEKPAIGVKKVFSLVEKAVDNLTSKK